MNIQALLLVGGAGTRLRSVLPSTPKPLAPIGGKLFLELLIQQLRAQGIRHLVMCTGYLADQIESEFGDGSALDVVIKYSKELSPMGTAGAISLARKHLIDHSEFLVTNGDSFLELNIHQLLQFHRERRAIATIATIEVGDASRYGTVEAGPGGRVVGFAEKSGSELPGLISGGVYIFSRPALNYFPEAPASLERDVFPRLLDQGVYALKQTGMFIDIGIPEDYARAQQICNQLHDAAEPPAIRAC